MHFARNLLAHVPKDKADMVASMFRMVFAQPDPAAVHASWDAVRDRLAALFPKIGPLMDQAKAEVLAFTSFPKAHWQKIWSTNPLVIQSQIVVVFDVHHERLRVGELRRGSGYLPRSMRQIFRRNDARPASPLARLAA